MNECPFCGANLYGTNYYCCRTGAINIPPQRKIPKELHELFFGNSREAKVFRNNVMLYNTLFSFASLQCHRIPAAAHGLQVGLTNIEFS